MNHDGLGALPGPRKPVQILMMVKGIAAGPIDQPDIGIAATLPVVVEFAARVEQHVGDPGHRYEGLDRIATLRQGWPGQQAIRAADIVGRTIGERDTAPRQSDLPEHRGQTHRRPEGLLAMVGPLQSPGDIDQTAVRGKFDRQITQALRRDTGNRCGPLGVFHDTIGLPEQIGLPAIEAHAMAGQKCTIVAVGAHDLASQGQHDCGVGAGAYRDPFE